MAAVEGESKMELKNSSSTDLIASCGVRTQKCAGFWISAHTLPAVKVMQREFQPLHDDIFLASLPKSGTTRCKALLHTIFQFSKEDTNFEASVDDLNPHSLVPTMEAHLFDSTVEHQQYDLSIFSKFPSPNPHSLVPTMEAHLFDSTVEHQQYDLSIFSKFPSPRLLHSHLPFHLLPPLVRTSACKIVYIARNPRDVFVSYWKFFNKLHEDGYRYSNGDLSKETLFDGYCSGFFNDGPFAERVLSYWHESRRDPNKAMFVTYEDLQADCVRCIKKLGLFLGCSPQLVEENAAIIAEKCSFQSLSTVEVNKTGRVLENKFRVPNHSFFREGKVGERKKHFTPQMEERIYLAIEQKLNNEGLYFKYSL